MTRIIANTARVATANPFAKGASSLCLTADGTCDRQAKQSCNVRPNDLGQRQAKTGEGETAPRTPGQDPCAAQRRGAEYKRHERFLADARRPEQQGRKEEHEPGIRPSVPGRNGHDERSVEKEESPESEPREDEEASEPTRSDHGVDDSCDEADQVRS
jgi:hypothetical protein